MIVARMARRGPIAPLAWIASLFLLGVIGASSCAGCGSRAPLPVRKVLVDVEPAAVGVDREQVRAVVDDVVSHARGIQIVEPSRTDAAVLRVRVEGYGPSTDSASDEQGNAHTAPQKTTLALTVEVTSVPGEPGTEYRGHALASGNGVIDARTLAGQAVRDALAQVMLSRSAGDLKSDQLIAWLNDDNSGTDQKKRAIRILGSRREKAAVDAIGKILASRDPDLAPVALSALENIGDPSAADAVIEFSDRQPAVVKKQCIEAVKAMGPSPHAKAWLFTLSTGAPDLDVQELASAALASLEAKAVTIELPTVAQRQDTSKGDAKTATP